MQIHHCDAVALLEDAGCKAVRKLSDEKLIARLRALSKLDEKDIDGMKLTKETSAQMLKVLEANSAEEVIEIIDRQEEETDPTPAVTVDDDTVMESPALSTPTKSKKKGKKGKGKKADPTSPAPSADASDAGTPVPASKKGRKGKAESNGKPAKKGKKREGMSSLDAAYRVLKESKKPLGRHDLIAKMAEKGYWQSPGGKTPQNTIAAQIYVEIKKKGKEARFKRSERGLFTAVK